MKPSAYSSLVIVFQLTIPARIRQSRGFRFPNVSSPPFSKTAAQISSELIALENEQWLARLADPRDRALLAELFRMALDDPRDYRPTEAPPAMSVRGGTFLS